MLFQLRDPITYRGRRITEVALRPPTQRELRKNYRADRIAMTLRVIAVVTNIPRPAVEEFSLTDLNAMAALLLEQPAEGE